MSRVSLITGSYNSGKSTRFLQRYQDAGATDSGLFSRKRLDAFGEVNGYDLLLLPDESSQRPLARACTDTDSFEQTDRLFHGRFVFSLSAFDDATTYIRSHPSPHVWIDEIGKLELQGLGYAVLLHELLANRIDLTLTVRDIYLPTLLSVYSIANYQIV